MALISINPFNNTVIQKYEELSPAEIETKLVAAKSAFQAWRRTSFAERAHLIKKAAEILRNQAHQYAQLIATEMGKVIKEGQAEIEKCAWACDYYADNAEKFLAPETVKTDARNSFITCQPLGVILAIMPWNFPFWQVFRFAAPALMAGNVGVLKHASNVSGCALAIEKIFQAAGFPDHVFTTLLISSQHIDNVIKNKNVAAVTLTGSSAAGKAVAAAAGSVVKKTVLELGGSDPYLILDDANLEKAVAAAAAGRLLNAGQSCIAAKRFIVTPKNLAQFESLFLQKLKSIQWGDPLQTNIDIGPLARTDLRDQLHQQVQASIAKGAQCILGGTIPNQAGAFYPPTILTRVTKGMPAYEEELFGPVAAIIAVADEAEAIKVANDSPYGLGSAIFSEDLAKAERIASEEIAAGSCYINIQVRSDPRLPFGGIKESGYGRELSHYGIKEFVNIKSVYTA